MLTWHNSAWDLQTASPEVALLPLAACEPHGPHLPIGADLIIMTEIARRVAERLAPPLFILPTWPLGASGQHAGQPGAIYLKNETLWFAVRDIVTSLHSHGIQRVVVLNNHGSAMTSTSLPLGNFIVKTAVRQLNYETDGLTAIWVQPFAAAGQALRALFSDPQQEVHAGAIETAILMHLAPEFVGDMPPDHLPDLDATYLNFMPFTRLSPCGVWGRPSEATPEKGAEALDLVSAATADYIRQTFAQLDKIKNSPNPV